MYADRRSYVSGRSPAIDPRSLGIAVALNGAVVAGLLLAHPSISILGPHHPLRTYNVPVPPPEALPPPPKHVERQSTAPRRTSAPRSPIPVPTDPDVPRAADPLPPMTLPPVYPGPTISPEPTPTPALVTVGAEVDPAHRGELQPAYPASELRAEHQGVVTVRVLIGVDGRVREVQQVSATSDAFFRATESQALRRWRFRPATRGGVPIEAWRSMTIRFVIPG